MQSGSPEQSNSYRLPSEIFPVSSVKKIVETVLNEYLKEKEYSTIQNVDELIKTILNQIKSKLSDKTNAKVDRFKYAIQLTISEKMNQALYTAAMCLWDHEHDNYVSVTFETSTFTAVCIIFGCLLE